MSSAATAVVFAEADLVAVFGAELNGWTTRGGTLCPGAKIQHRDLDDEALARSTLDASVRLRGDAAEAVARVQEILGGGGSVQGPWWSSATTAELEVESATGRLDPRRLCRELDRLLPKERTVTIDGGHFLEFPCRYMSVPDERGFIFTLGFGAVGLALFTAIGAASGRPDRLSIAVVGDGG